MSSTPPSELRQAVLALRPYALRAAGFSWLAALLMLAPTLYMLQVYDRVLSSRSSMTLAMLTLLVLGVYAVMELLDWTRTALMHAAGLALDQRLGARLFDALFAARRAQVPGGTVQTLKDLRCLREFLHAPVLLALVEAPVALVFLLLIFLISPVLGWSALAGALLQTLLAWLTERSTQPPLQAASSSALAAQQYANSCLRNAQVIASMGMLRDVHQRWQTRQREFLAQQAQASDAAAIYQALAKAMQQAMGALLLGLGAWLLLRNQFAGGAGMVLVGSILGGRMLAPLVQIVSQWRTVVQAREAWGRLETLLTQVPRPPQAMALPRPAGHLRVDNLSATAPGSARTILRGLQFALQPGEVLAVVGPSASGKTTLARLLVGVWPAAAGKVRLDGSDVAAWDRAELGPHIGYLPQGLELMEGSLADNIARFGVIDQTAVEAAAQAVDLHGFIQSLPQGYDTLVGRDGAVLSGGQRQRVALARALYGQPVLVVLDEPNSSLDEAGDAALAQAIQRAKRQGTTFVVMTQRTAILAVVDKVLVLNEGQQQAFGPRDAVLAALAKATQAQADAATHAHAEFPLQSSMQGAPSA